MKQAAPVADIFVLGYPRFFPNGLDMSCEFVRADDTQFLNEITPDLNATIQRAAAAAGVTYGAHGIWSWETVDGRPPLDHERTGAARIWHIAKDLPGSRDVTRIAEILGGLRWWRLRPAPALLAAQPGGDAPERFVAAARTVEGDAALLYLPAGGEVTLTESGWTRALWLDPRGAGASVPAASEDGLRFTAPAGDGDHVLILER